MRTIHAYKWRQKLPQSLVKQLVSRQVTKISHLLRLNGQIHSAVSFGTQLVEKYNESCVKVYWIRA